MIARFMFFYKPGVTLGRPRLESLILLLQRGGQQLDLLGLLLRRGLQGVTLVDGSG